MSSNNYSYDGEPPTLFEALQAAQDFGLVGEEDTVLTLVLSMIRGHLVVMSGLSRAGKDFTVDAAESLFPSESMIYHWPVDDSETAAYYKRGEINQYPVHRFPDLARLPEHQEKILKSFGEGRDAERSKTDIIAEKAGGDAVEDQVLRCPHTVIAFIASDNENIDLDDFPEIRNRSLVVSVDASEEQTHAVNRRKAEERQGAIEPSVDPLRKAEIQDYHASIPVDEWVQTPGNQILNPASVEIHRQEPIPEKFPEARQDFDRLLEFMETVTLYHYTDRIVGEANGGRVMLVAPEDIWMAMTILGNKMIMSALNLTREDRAILHLLDGSKAALTKSDIQQALRNHGFNISDRDVKRSLRSMREKGYITEHQGNPNSYTRSEFASVTKHEAGINYESVVDSAVENVYDLVGDRKAELYRDEFCTGDGLITTHPFKGQAVDITEDDDLEEMMDTGIEGIEEILEDESAPAAPEEPVGEAIGQAQGTLG